MEDLEEEAKGPANLMCMLCCNKYKHKNGGLSTVIRFRQFCKELECVLAEKQGTQQSFKKRRKLRFKGNLNLAYGDLSICPECLKLICSAIKIKTNARDVEEQVLNLQMKVLELMTELNGRMGTFLTRMKMIESVVRDSDVQRLTAYLDENVTDELKGDAIQFRERIIEAVEDLRIYRKELTDKVYCENLIRRKEKRLINANSRKTQTDICGEIEPVSTKNRKSANKSRLKLKHSGQQTDPICIVENADEQSSKNNTIVKAEVDLDDYYMGDDGPCNFDDDYDGCQDFLKDNNNDMNESSLPNLDNCEKFNSGRPKRAAATKRKLNSPPSSNECSSEEDFSDTDESDEDVDETASNFSEDDFDMQRIKCTKKKRSLFENLDVSQMSKFKRNIVALVLKKQERRLDIEEYGEQSNLEGGGEPGSNLTITEDIRDNFLVQYNPENGQLTLEGIEIVCNEVDQSLQCSLCDFTAESPNTAILFSRIHNHILGRHLDAYRCVTCSTLLSSFRTYTEHVAGHKQLTICDICGKGLRNRESLRSHKWLHMNEDERADAIQRGVTNPRESSIKRKMKPRNLPCSTCGKLFRNEGQVRNHERTHTEREKIPCHLCGKLLLNEASSLHYHQTYSCSAVEQEAKECPKCHKRYKNITILKRHMVTEHSSTPLQPIFCELCGRQCKTKGNLRKHMIDIHSNERPFSCSDCEASFKSKNNLNRHAKTCKMRKTKNASANNNTPQQRIQQPKQETTEASRNNNSQTNAQPIMPGVSQAQFSNLFPIPPPTAHLPYPADESFKREASRETQFFS